MGDRINSTTHSATNSYLDSSALFPALTSAGATSVYGAGGVAFPTTPVILYEAELTSTTVRYAGANRNYTVNGNIFYGVADLISVSKINETTEIKANGITVRLSGIDPTQLNTVQTEITQGKKINILMGFAKGDDGDLIDDPINLFTGFVDTPTIQMSDTDIAINITAENKLIDLQRARTLRYTDATQQELFAGDLGLEFVAILNDIEIPWGQAGDYTLRPVQESGSESG